jgi:hypothetical protein
MARIMLSIFPNSLVCKILFKIIIISNKRLKQAHLIIKWKPVNMGEKKDKVSINETSIRVSPEIIIKKSSPLYVFYLPFM